MSSYTSQCIKDHPEQKEAKQIRNNEREKIQSGNEPYNKEQVKPKQADDIKVPSLIPVDCGIFDCCASYIQEDYDDWDIQFQTDKPEEKVKDFKFYKDLMMILKKIMMVY